MDIMSLLRKSRRKTFKQCETCGVKTFYFFHEEVARCLKCKKALREVIKNPKVRGRPRKGANE